MAKTAEEKREYRREYYARNREKILARQKVWREANREKERERVRAWREKNPEKVKEIARAWREKNPEKVKEIVRAYYARNREKILEKKKEQRRRKKDEKSAKDEKNTVVHGALCGDAAGGVLDGMGSGGDEPVGTAGVCAADGAAAADLLEPFKRGGDTP